MRNSIYRTALCALSVIVVTTGPAISLAATVDVVRGMKTETVDTARTPAGGVRIIRPVHETAAPKPVAAKPSARTEVTQETYVAGDTLWTRDSRTGQLVACAFGTSGTVGKYVIRCTGGDRYGR